MQVANRQIYDDIDYRTNYLTEVIARLDLVSPIPSLANELPKEISKFALREFPIDEPKRAFTQQIEVAPDRLSTSRTDFTEWNFYGSNRDRRLALTPQFFFITLKKYETFEQLRDSFLGFSEQFFDGLEQAQPSRLGLRYINNIRASNGSPLDWYGLISDELLGMYTFEVPDTQPVRNFHNMEFKYDDFNLRFQFGMHNPDYPAAIRQKIFILDFDAYFQGAFENNQMPAMLDNFHNAIQTLFERSITDNLRERMNAK